MHIIIKYNDKQYASTIVVMVIIVLPSRAPLQTSKEQKYLMPVPFPLQLLVQSSVSMQKSPT